jgi:hypothetical protein
LLDFHISDWDPLFLSRFDPDEFAEYVARSNSTAATVFANTHTGLCNYPTAVGQVHAQFVGRDVLGETIDCLHRRGLDVVVYYCTIYVDWYWETHPESRSVDARGESRKLMIPSAGRAHRFSVCCMNDPGYREFVVAQLGEICDRYDFEGVWPDMTMWPTVCYCASCRERYRRETGLEIPQTIDWVGPDWVRFQHRRQEWLREFIHLVTSTIKSKKPGVTVAHQSGSFCSDWMVGPSVEAAAEMDWLSADLYGDRYRLSFWAKLFYQLSETRPFEHISTWCYPSVFEHVVTRTEDLLRANAFSALANDGAIVFIDAIDPSGAIHKQNYLTVGKVFGDLVRYEPYAGGTQCQDIAIYYSLDANIDLGESGRDVADAGYSSEPDRPRPGPTAHRNAALNLARTLMLHHLPFGVITKKNLPDLARYQIVLLPNVTVLGPEELAAFHAYVAEGGSLYASKHTSMVGQNGVGQDDFALADLFGVSYRGETSEIITYLKPHPEHGSLFAPFSADMPVTLRDTQLLVQPQAQTEILATLTLPYTDPRGTRYASLLTDPPGRDTEHPALVLHRYGKGQVLYAAGVVESWEYDTQRAVLINLLRLLATRPFAFETDAPSCVEIILYDQPDKQRYVVHALNFQQELPNIPVYGARVGVRMDGRVVRQVTVLPQGQAIPYRENGVRIEFTLPRLETYAALAVEYQPGARP